MSDSWATIPDHPPLTHSFLLVFFWISLSSLLRKPTPPLQNWKSPISTYFPQFSPFNFLVFFKSQSEAMVTFSNFLISVEGWLIKKKKIDYFILSCSILISSILCIYCVRIKIHLSNFNQIPTHFLNSLLVMPIIFIFSYFIKWFLLSTTRYLRFLLFVFHCSFWK